MKNRAARPVSDIDDNYGLLWQDHSLLDYFKFYVSQVIIKSEATSPTRLHKEGTQFY